MSANQIRNLNIEIRNKYEALCLIVIHTYQNKYSIPGIVRRIK